ncbi:MAG: hypothetical protein LBN33_05800 [Desulfovibrio sp.]|nr:hypothetical protein [Desulfovibrio sp.]
MLLFDDSKALEKAIGEEAAAVIAHVLEKADVKWRQDLATKADLQAMRNDLLERIAGTDNRIADFKHEILKWMIGGFLAQSALLIAVISFLK